MTRLRIEVVYALPGAQEIVRLDLAPGANAGMAVAASGLRERYTIGANCDIGLAGERILPGHPLRDGDRVELLRPLALDPNEARRKRARGARFR